MASSRRIAKDRAEFTTTVTLPTALMEDAKILAVRQHRPLKALIVDAVTEYLARHTEDAHGTR